MLHFRTNAGAGRLGRGLAGVALGLLGLVGCGSSGEELPVDESPIVGTPLAEAPPAPSSRFPRLTHPQWVNTVNDLFGFEEASQFASEFRADPVIAGYLFDANASQYEVDEALWGTYRRAARLLVEHVSQDEALLARILPPEEGEATERARRFVERFGARVHRRALSPEAVDGYMRLFAAGGELYPEGDAFRGGIRIVLEAMLQSPYFLYRVELGKEPKNGVIPLDPFEIAQRLSYALWDTMPDDELFEAASNGQLDTPHEVAVQARRLLDDPRAHAVIASFHEQLFGFEKFGGIFPSRVYFPDVSPRLGEFALAQARLFVRHTLLERSGTYADLLLSNETPVNGPLARVYGLEGDFREEFVIANLDDGERRGLFTQVGFLGANATPVHPDPIHRGIFLSERVACVPIAAPPDMIPALPAPEEGQTNRETVEALTEQPGTVCRSCHETVINPFGFPFEVYDAVGAYRTTDNGLPVDSTASPPIDRAPTPVSDAVDLMEKLAASKGVHECYAKHWLEYAYGRNSVDQDKNLVARIGAFSLDGASVRELILGLVTAEAFLNRSVEELP